MQQATKTLTQMLSAIVIGFMTTTALVGTAAHAQSLNTQTTASEKIQDRVPQIGVPQTSQDQASADTTPFQVAQATQATTVTQTKVQPDEAVAAVPADLVGKPVVSLEGTTVGEVASVQTDTTGKLAGIQAKVGGILGFGADDVTIPADKFRVDSDMIIVAMTESQIEHMAD